MDEKANVTIYDPQVEHEQIWMDLQEVAPKYSLQQSEYPPLSHAHMALELNFLAVVQKQVQIAQSAIDACHEAEAVVIATEWKDFIVLDWQEVYDHMMKPAFVFDGRLLLDAAHLTKIGFKVTTIGRGVEIPAALA
jgi:UDPglucose 6-dehydrogenase